MADVWYYADKSETKGPMSLSDLVRALSVMHSPGDAMVWRAGFQAWRKATDVVEIAERVFGPPPLPTSPFPPRPAPPPVSEPSFNAEPLPIGGWLILVALGQILGPLRLLASIGQYYSTLDWKLAERFSAAFVGEAFLSVAYFAVIIVTSVLFFRRSRAFPRFFVYEVIATIVYLPLGTVWVAMTISAASGQSFNDLFASAFDPKETGRTIAAGIVGCLWIWYLYKSKRVAKTFIR